MRSAARSVTAASQGDWNFVPQPGHGYPPKTMKVLKDSKPIRIYRLNLHLMIQNMLTSCRTGGAFHLMQRSLSIMDDHLRPRLKECHEAQRIQGLDGQNGFFLNAPRTCRDSLFHPTHRVPYQENCVGWRGPKIGACSYFVAISRRQVRQAPRCIPIRSDWVLDPVVGTVDTLSRDYILKRSVRNSSTTCRWWIECPRERSCLRHSNAIVAKECGVVSVMCQIIGTVW